jgi:tetratricopeptide (TPR) repeat protein
MGRQDEAIAAYKEAIRLQPRYAAAHYNLAIALCKKGLLDDAIAASKEAIRLQPEDTEAHNNLGTALHQKGLIDEAIAAYKEAIRLKPDFATAYFNLGISVRQKGRLDEAIAAYKEVIRLQAGYAEGHFFLGFALRQKGQLDEAIAAYKEAIRLRPDFVNPYRYLADLLANGADPKLRDAAEAVRLARKAVELARLDALSWQTLGWALYRTDAWKDSIEVFHKSMALQENPKGGDSGQWFGVAVAHWQLGNKEEARKWNDQAVQWMEKNAPQDEWLRGFRAEAEKLLELKK